MNIGKWKSFKKILNIVSVILGTTIPIICFVLIDEINLITEPLSKFGVDEKTWLIWVIFTSVLSVMIYFRNRDIISNIEGYYGKILKVLNILTSSSLMLTGIIDMNYKIIHLTFASVFFLSYTGFMFWWGVSKIKYDLKNSIISIVLSLIVILSTFTFISFNLGYGVFEVIFMVCIILWNILQK
jgi:hypothetical protein